MCMSSPDCLLTPWVKTSNLEQFARMRIYGVRHLALKSLFVQAKYNADDPGVWTSQESTAHSSYLADANLASFPFSTLNISKLWQLQCSIERTARVRVLSRPKAIKITPAWTMSPGSATDSVQVYSKFLWHVDMQAMLVQAEREYRSRLFPLHSYSTKFIWWSPIELLLFTFSIGISPVYVWNLELRSLCGSKRENAGFMTLAQKHISIAERKGFHGNSLKSLLSKRIVNSTWPTPRMNLGDLGRSLQSPLLYGHLANSPLSLFLSASI